MRPLVIANVELVETMPFLVARLYGEDGYLLDEITVPYEGPADACDRIAEIGRAYRLETVEMWTSETALYVAALRVPGIAATYKHPSDTNETRHAVEKIRDILVEIYDIPPRIPKPRPPKWRAFLIRVVRWILNKLEGAGKYEI
ncbi:hypothetical protein M4D57_20275 [Brevibacillus borstelensis]|uniref:hypothetical protein n=1 Tax=Brevibacillus borstelensis TaxID=45462 RepID=UPI00203F7DD1|nr:hypothetical protein [Brevibacillus borstelensis]MCM3560904.1 hypothetical protein [Brevibacillus borstelensis]